MVITPLYAGVLTLLFLALSFRVIGARRSQRISLGDGNNAIMLRRMRAHGNFAEYVPLALVLMMLLELQNQSIWMVHVVGMLLLLGRVSHAIGVSRAIGTARILGMVLTFAALIVGALANLATGSLLARLAG